MALLALTFWVVAVVAASRAVTELLLAGVVPPRPRRLLWMASLCQVVVVVGSVMAALALQDTGDDPGWDLWAKLNVLLVSLFVVQFMTHRLARQADRLEDAG